MSDWSLVYESACHDEDIKDIAVAQNSLIFTVSRDASVKGQEWTSGHLVPGFESSNLDKNYVNSVTVLSERNILVIGCLSGNIRCFNLHTGEELQGEHHDANVSCLDSAESTLISGSWDCTAKVMKWNGSKFEGMHVLTAHTNAVWSVKILDASKELYLTAGADKMIYLWQIDRVCKRFMGHTDAVRALLPLQEDELLVSASNDGSLRVWDLKLTGGAQSNAVCLDVTTDAHDGSFIYCLTALKDGKLVTGGEDGSARVWTRDRDFGLKCTQVIRHPCISVWKVASFPHAQAFCSGGSDGHLRVFAHESEKSGEFLAGVSYEAIERLQETFQQAVLACNVAKSQKPKEFQNAPTVEELMSASADDIPEGKTAVAWRGKVLEAYTFTQGSWKLVGSVLDSNAEITDSHTTAAGQKMTRRTFEWDVDIADDLPPLKLHYCSDQIPEQAADEFLRNHAEVPRTYRDTIVQFIKQNSN